MPVAHLSDVRLAYEIAGSGPPLVLLHGLSGNLDTERRLAERLARRFRVLWYSARGHGQSDAPVQDRGYGYRAFAADLDAMIDLAGFHRPFLVGGSHGANTILRHAVEYPGRARAAVLLAPGGNAIDRPRRSVLAGLQVLQWWALRQGMDGLVRLVTGTDPTTGHADPVAVAAVRTHEFERIRRVLRQVPAHRAVRPERLSDVQLPCVVAGWPGDPVIHPEAVARRIAALLPQGRFEPIERPDGWSAERIAETADARIADWYRLLVGPSD